MTKKKAYSPEFKVKVVREIDEERREHGREVDDLNRIVGQLTVERDCLQRSLGKKLDELGL